MSKPPDRAGEGSLSALIAALVVAGVLLRWIDLDLRGLWWDELFSVVSSSTSPSLSTLWSEWMVDDSHPPGFQPLLWLWFKVVPATEFWARAPSAVASTVALVYAAIGTRHVLSQSGRAILTSLLAFSYLNVYYAQEARQYATVMLLGLIVSDIALRLCRGQGTRRLWLGLVLVGLLAAYTHYFGLFLVVLWFLILAVTVWRVDGRTGLQHCAIAAAAFAVAYIPGVLTFLHLVGTGNGAWQRRKPTEKFVEQLYSGFFAQDTVATTVMLSAIGLVSIFGWWRWRRRAGSTSRIPLGPLTALLVIAALVVMAANQRSPVLQVRYYLVFFAPTAILIAGSASWLLRGAPVALVGLVTLLPAIGLSAWYPAYREYPKQGWREATEWVIENYEPGDSVAVLGPSGAFDAGELLQAGMTRPLFWLRNHTFFQYYFDRIEGEPSGAALQRLPNVKPRGTMPAQIAAGDPSRFILLAGHHMHLDKKLKRYLSRRYATFERVKFKSTRIFVFADSKPHDVNDAPAGSPEPDGGLPPGTSPEDSP